MTRVWLLIIFIMGLSGLAAFSQNKLDEQATPGSGVRSFLRGGHNLTGYGHFRHEYTKEDDYTVVETDTTSDKPDSMGIIRLRMNLYGALQGDLNYSVEYDFQNSMMTDAFVQMKHLPYYDWTMTIGQFKIPFADAGKVLDTPYQELIKGPFIYEARYPTSTTISDREIGVMVEGEMLERKGVYAIGFFNGNGINTADDNDQKDMLFHFHVSPWKEERNAQLKPLEFGASYMKGKVQEATIGVDEREKYAYTMKYEIEDVTFTYEYVYQDINVDGPRDRTAKSWYLQASRDFDMDFLKKQQKMRVLSRYENYENDSLVEDDEITCLTAGVNWLMNKYVRVQMNYISINETSGADSEEWLFQLEVKF